MSDSEQRDLMENFRLLAEGECIVKSDEFLSSKGVWRPVKYHGGEAVLVDGAMRWRRRTHRYLQEGEMVKPEDEFLLSYLPEDGIKWVRTKSAGLVMTAKMEQKRRYRRAVEFLGISRHREPPKEKPPKEIPAYAEALSALQQSIAAFTS